MIMSIRKYFNEHPDHFDPRQYLSPARTAIKGPCRQQDPRNVLGSSNTL